MLKDLVIQCIQDFQRDCLALCENHYPTVHNRGMSEHHLARAFTRRMSSTFDNFGYASLSESLETVRITDHPHHYLISSELGTVWVITHHMASASNSCREKLLADISEWQSEYGYAIQPSDLLVLLSDHWISRSRQSRELLSWWLGDMPDEITEFSQQGITLYQSESQLTHTLDQRFQIRPCYLRFGHPLVRAVNQQLVRKYLQLYAILEWQK